MPAQVRHVAEIFAGEDIADVNLDHRCADGRNGIGDGHGGVRVGASVEHDAVVSKTEFMQFVDQLSFHIALKITQGNCRKFLAKCLEVAFERLVTIDVFFTASQQVQVGAVDYCYL